MKVFFGVLLCLPFLVWTGVRTVASIQFDRKCEGYLKRAADANTVELAREQLQVAVDYAQRKGLTSGYTSILWTTPDADVGFWFKNLVASLAELNRVTPATTQLERSNILIKLRETLLDQGQGVTVTVPEGISIYPHNALFMFWAVFSGILGVIGALMILIGWDDY